MQRDDASVLLRRQLAECATAVERHTAVVDALSTAALEEATQQPPLSGWLVAAGRVAAAAPDALDPNPPRLWFDLTEFGADATGQEDCSAALSAALHAASAAGGGATVLIPAGSYRVASPVLVSELDPEPELESDLDGVMDSGSPLSCAVHLVGEGPQHSQLLWEAPEGWQLLPAAATTAAAGGGTAADARRRWWRPSQSQSSFPIALASHGLVLVQLSIRCAAEGGTAATAAAVARTARVIRSELLQQRGGSGSSSGIDMPTAARRLPIARYDVRLQCAEILGKNADGFDPSSLQQREVLLAAEVEAAGAEQQGQGSVARCRMQHAKQRDHSMPQNLKRGCAVCDHSARAHNAAMLLQAYESWLAGATAADAGDLGAAAAAFGQAGAAAAAAGEEVEAGLLWSNCAECLIRRGLPEHTDAALDALRKAMQYWPGHGDSRRRLAFVAEKQQVQTQAAATAATNGGDGGGGATVSPAAATAGGGGGGGGCCDLDVSFFGFQRTGAKALSHLAGDLYGAAAELEAALALGSARAVWRHADSRTPREIRMGGSSALNVAVPNGTYFTYAQIKSRIYLRT